ncbi:MAG TPA: Mut7-C RNAse domain-containing protein [Gemmataceae bacterium]|nr:Mut7-C RNAse domain-containing protein [Gemmataceae bacterium]
MQPTSEPRFACDAMLGGLARWLRAAGYDAWWQADIDDWDLIRLARREECFLLTSDTGILRIGIIRDGEVPSLFIPHGLGKEEQLAFVLRHLNLKLRPPRCMGCGGPLQPVPSEELTEQVPGTRAWIDAFYRCGRCGKIFWEGTHWQHIARVLQRTGKARDEG